MTQRRAKFVLPIEPDPCPELPIETGPRGDGVGIWVPQEKHTLLAKWLGGTREARRNWSNRVYIDPFCGPGCSRVSGETITRDGGAAVAWRQSVVYKTPFTRSVGH